MDKAILNELAHAQQKLEAINTLTNCIAKIDNVEYKNEIAYDIHRIIEANEFSSTEARIVTGWNILANKDLFITVTK